MSLNTNQFSQALTGMTSKGIGSVFDSLGAREQERAESTPRIHLKDGMSMPLPMWQKHNPDKPLPKGHKVNYSLNRDDD